TLGEAHRALVDPGLLRQRRGGDLPAEPGSPRLDPNDLGRTLAHLNRAVGGELLPRLARVAGPGDEVEPEVRGDRQRLDAGALELILGMLLAEGWGGGRFEGAGPEDRGDRPRLGRVFTPTSPPPHSTRKLAKRESTAAAS